MAHRALLSRLSHAPLLRHHVRCFLTAATPPPDESSPPPPPPPPPSNSKLFVAGLSWSADERSLMDAFSSFGTVTEVRIMYDKNSGRSRGFGFVHFSNGYEAKCAKDDMDGKVQLYEESYLTDYKIVKQMSTVFVDTTGNARTTIADKFCS